MICYLSCILSYLENGYDHLIEDVNDSNSLDLAQNDWGRTKYIGYYGWASKINQPTKAIVETPENKGKQNQVTILDQMGLKIEVENDKALTLINKLMGSNSSQKSLQGYQYKKTENF
jgi:hypothetical protein